MEKSVIFAVVFTLLLLFGFLTWYFSHRARHKERLLRIEKGIPPIQERTDTPFPWLKLGVVVLGLGVGLLLIAILANNGLLKGPGSLPISILAICGGLSLVIANYIGKK
ncbi:MULTISPECIES: DUF6249 domain-containing protein [unclassified Sphingobacterium]|uniref:DUF6249 domain-containing protein n=1 Tax=unclassified Sphingobacterium TaxID=2609468 RepID=UPI0025DF30CB|nr:MULTISPECIES: DUF6249 domain-containing protein [unclassified Sphingobacterium]